MNEREWLNNSELGIDIWCKKYQHQDESFDEWLDRVSGGNPDVRQLILDKKFLFGGRILSNRGIDAKVTLSNCYVIEPPEDNIESIFDCAKKLARTFSYGGGCGIDIGKLRPRNAKVNNSAKRTSGSVSFMDLYSQVTELIGQNGRRGALMISIPCNHPDLLDFIELKSDLNKVTKANVSVRITSEFMQAVKAKSKFDLVFEVEATGETITETVDAYELFRKLCEINWDFAEPGILFWDRIEKWNLLSETPNFKFAGTNPCISGDSLIQTVDGLIPVKNLVGKQPYLYCMDDNGDLTIAKANKVWLSKRNAKALTVMTSKGSITCTPDHKIYTTNRGWVKAEDIEVGDRLKGLNRQMASEIHVSVGLSGSSYKREHRFVLEHFKDITGLDVHHIDGNPFNNRLDNLQAIEHGAHSAISNTGRKIEFHRDMLNGRFLDKGEDKKKRKGVNQGKRTGFNWNVIQVVENDCTEDVYDIEVPQYNNFVANDIIVHNCAEEPLPAGGSCLLGALNLAEFVTNGKFDFGSFKTAVDTAVVGLNEVLEEGLPLHPLEEQRRSVNDWRQIGLGIMGLADMLIKMKIAYGSVASLMLCEKIASTLLRTAFQTSVRLGKEFGSYPMFKKENVVETDFYKNNLNGIECDTLRNSQLLTIAPTGTISTMFGISGGIEPIFANYYTRKTESLHGEDKYYKVFTPIVQQYFDDNGLEADDGLLPKYFVTAQELDFKDRIDMQSAWQTYIDASISSTVNVPNEFTQQQICDLYMYAYDKGLKGVTIYRDGCKRSGILTLDTNKIELVRGQVVKTNNDVFGLKRTLQTGCGTLHCTAFFDRDTGELVETYLSKGSSGGCNNFMIGLSRMISLAARGGVKIGDIVDQLKSCGTCPSYAVRSAMKKDTSIGTSCPVAVGNALLEMYGEEKQKIGSNVKCPNCGQDLTFEGGCNSCKSCGYSKCD